MKRSTKYLSEPEKLLSTFHTLNRRFPQYPGIADLDGYDWAEYRSDDDDTLSDLEEAFEEHLNKFLELASDSQIRRFFMSLRNEEKLQPAKIHVRNTIPDKFEKYGPKRLKGVPRSFTTPLFPFPSVRRNSGAMLQLSKPLIKNSDGTSLTVKNVALFPRDMKTLVALTEIMKRQPLESYGSAFISFRTTITDILEEMGVSNPRAKAVRDGLWNSLERMRSCTITWADKKGRRNTGGILSKARELEEDSSLEVEIFLDVDFLKIYKGGFSNLDKKALYHMSDREIVMYMFFDGKLRYKQTGKFNIDVLELYDQITIEMDGTNRPEYKKRYQMKELIERCQEIGIIGKYSFNKDKELRIRSLGHLFNN